MRSTRGCQLCGRFERGELTLHMGVRVAVSRLHYAVDEWSSHMRLHDSAGENVDLTLQVSAVVAALLMRSLWSIFCSTEIVYSP